MLLSPQINVSLQAMGLHPDLLVEELSAEVAVPYDDSDSLDAVEATAARGEVGEATEAPSSGSIPHRTLVVKSVHPDTGGFTTSLPAVDPAYDDVGRAMCKDGEWRAVRRAAMGMSHLFILLAMLE